MEDDIEDFGGLAIARSQRDNDNGKAVTRYFVSIIFLLIMLNKNVC